MKQSIDNCFFLLICVLPWHSCGWNQKAPLSASISSRRLRMSWMQSMKNKKDRQCSWRQASMGRSKISHAPLSASWVCDVMGLINLITIVSQERKIKSICTAFFHIMIFSLKDPSDNINGDSSARSDLYIDVVHTSIDRYQRQFVGPPRDLL